MGSLAQPSPVVIPVRVLLLSAFALGLSPCRAQLASASGQEHVILVGGPDARITWIVYCPAYLTRGADDGKLYLQSIESLALNYRVQLIWADSGNESIATINKRPAGSIKTFGYFGHPNPHAFVLDYGIEILAIFKTWIHERDLAKIQREVFGPEPLCNSWDCHTGQSMSLAWRQSLGTRLIGAEGRNYADVSQKAPLPSTDGPSIR